MGVAPERIFSASPYAPPDELFHPGAPPLDVDSFPHKLDPSTDEAAGGPRRFDPSRPTIGIYGKVGVTKGSFDLLQALAILQREGLEFNFLTLTQGRSFEPFAAAIRELGLTNRSWILPFIPNWRVPSFIRTCTAVCFLERDFPVTIHTPTIAQEILLAGGCLVLSGEIARKQHYRNAMVDGENLLIVADPRDVNDLAAKLRQVIVAPDAAREIGLRGRSLVENPAAFDQYIESWEQIFFRIAGRPSTARNLVERFEAGLEDAATTAETLGRILPWVSRVLPGESAALLRRFLDDREASSARPVRSRIELGQAFCEFLRAHLAAGELAEARGFLEACLEFQEARWAAQQDDDRTRRVVAFPAVDQLGGGPVDSPRALSLKPLRSAQIRLLELDYDVAPLFSPPVNGNHRPGAAVTSKATMIFCFHRASNLKRSELKISSFTRELLTLCDGSRTTDVLVNTFAERISVQPSERPQAADQVLHALQTFYDQRVLIFCQ
jgi:hypothetical protein